MEAIGAGNYSLPNGEIYELRVESAERKTIFYPPKSLQDWSSSPATSSTDRNGPQISILEISTLHASRLLAKALHRQIGILNFASATSPGGGFKNGAQAQEESIARSSTLYPTLISEIGRNFYHLHNQGPRNPFYTDAIVYSPDVQLFRDDRGAWMKPIAVDVLTCAAVNANEVRELEQGRTRQMDERINETMATRMAQILYVFEQMGIRDVVLGSFGTGVFGNDVGVVARIWADLLSVPSARFRNSFDRVIFAVVDGKSFGEFEASFNRHISL